MLVEREVPLARLERLVEPARAGCGRLVLLGGEAGAGKSTLLAALAGIVADRLVTRQAICDGTGPAAALGPLLDAFPELAEYVERDPVDRRVLYRRLREAVSAPTLLLIEDLHWADEATLDLLHFLGRRLDGLPLLAVATFRDDEVPAGSPLALTLGHLATAPGVERTALAPLSSEGVRRLVEAAGSGLDADALHRSTGGNPFFVTEVLAQGGSDLPVTVRDAVLTRVARLSSEAQDVLAAAAVLGDRADLSLLSSVSGASSDGVDECVRAGVLVPDGDGWTFRHELTRRAVEQTTAPGTKARLHSVALRALRTIGSADDARLAHHAAACGDREAVLIHAPAAAVRRARLGAHREAAQLYRLALRCTGRSHPSRAALSEALSYECYLTNETEEALVTRQEAMRLCAEAGDTRAVGIHLRWLSRLSWFLGRREDEARFADSAVATLEAVDDRHELAMAVATRAAVKLHVPDTAAAVIGGRRALALGRRLGDTEVQMHALATIGTALAARGGTAGWWSMRRSLELALHADAHEHVGRVYLNLGALGLLNRRYREVDNHLAAALAYCDERDLDAFGVHILLGGARSSAEQARYEDAERYLDRVRSRPNLSPLNRMALHHVAGQLAMRRGGQDAGALDEAWRLAATSGEEQQMVPVAEVRAEGHWIAGRIERIGPEIDRVWPQALAQGNPWSLGELSWWLSCAGVRRAVPVPLAEPFRLMLQGEWRTAARRWAEIGCPLWRAYALGCAPDVADARQAMAIVEEIGASAAGRALLRERRARGLAVPHRPRASTRANPARLTARELDVLRLLADGLSNQEVARRLVLSERTVAHHVSAVLRKLGAPTRARAVATAHQAGMLGASLAG